jgi:hypothetical protein
VRHAPDGGTCGGPRPRSLAVASAAVRVVDLDSAGSFAWMAHPDEFMQRSSTALRLEDGWLLVDPLDAQGLDARLAGAPVIAVTWLLDRHRRDADAIAERHGAPRRLARGLGGLGLDELALGLREIRVTRRPLWREVVLWQQFERRLVTGEALGTAGYFHSGAGERVSVHPIVRLRPPRVELGGLSPEQICAGHGAPLLDGATPALGEALWTARRRLPAAWLRAFSAARAARGR